MTTTSTPIALSPKLRPAMLAKAADLLEVGKPRMNLLVVSTTAVGFYMAARHHADWLRLPATLVGTAFSAAGASVLNQVIERRRDALMPRTRNRPIPTGRLDPAQALGYGLGLAIGGVALLALLINPLTAALAAFTVLSYVLIYTPLKPKTTLNTIVGAVPGAIPPVMGWTAVRGSMGAEAFVLFSILFLWQIPHFLAIAILYRQDYAAAGFKMLPVVDRRLSATGMQIVLFSAALVVAAVMPTFLGVTSAAYLTPAVLLSLAFMAFGMGCATNGSRAEARKLFLVSIIYLPLLLGAMMICRV